jgi:hypothetical protein
VYPNTTIIIKNAGKGGMSPVAVVKSKVGERRIRNTQGAPVGTGDLVPSYPVAGPRIWIEVLWPHVAFVCL